MKTRLTYCLGSVAAFGLLLPAPNACAELPPGSYEILKKKASEVLEVEVIKVEKKARYGAKIDLVYTVKITKAERSGSGLKSGQEIRIGSYHYENPPPPGPANPPLLKMGWKGRVYLNRETDGNDYQIAAYGRSFETTEE